ncbi:MAG TPA: hypothetical protein DDZ88_30540 [Verrucomicrobiales bacterium]|nr:hypothetical protein [Verrucomicrobiales bacterium]
MIVAGMKARQRKMAPQELSTVQPATVASENSNGLQQTIADNMPSFIASLGICAAFFMPWLTVMGGLGVSGNTLGRIGNVGQAAWIVFVLAAISALTHFARPAKPLNVVAGLAPFALLFYVASKMGSELFQILGIGAWLTLGCGLVLLVAPVKSPR